LAKSQKLSLGRSLPWTLMSMEVMQRSFVFTGPTLILLLFLSQFLRVTPEASTIAVDNTVEPTTTVAQIQTTPA